VTVYEDLLALQALDITAEQLRYKKEHLPERAQLAERQQALVALERDAAARQGERDGVARTEKRLEDEIATVRAKKEHAESNLYSGTTNSPKELQAIQDEIESLGRRQRDLEDEELEAMELAEPLDAALASLDEQRAAIDVQSAALLAAIAEAEVALDGDLELVLDERATKAAPIDDGVRATYDELRRSHAGIAVARLIGNRCDGCHLELPAMEIDQIRHLPPDAEVRCSECDRLLVR
jgi:uncharacterized protein